MKKKLILVFTGIIFVVALFYIFIKPSEDEQQSELTISTELIDTIPNNQSMSVNEYVTNTLKSSLKSTDETRLTTLSSDNNELYYFQAPIIFSDFMYSENPEMEVEGSTDESGQTVYAYDKDTPVKYSFYAENEGFYAIPTYIILPGNHEDIGISYTAVASHDGEELAVWDQYIEAPVYDEEKDITKWLMVFKLPVGDSLPEEMGVSLTIDADGEIFQ